MNCIFFFYRKLINLLESFKQTGLVSEKIDGKVKLDGKPSSGDASSSSAITYELYYAPEHARLNQLANAAMLEKRIDHLEILIGNNPDKLVSLQQFGYCLCLLLSIF